MVAALALLSGCATEVPHHQLEIAGPHAEQLSPSDIQQLRQLGAVHRDYGTLWKVDVRTAHKVRVEFRRGPADRVTFSAFLAIKRGGGWILDESAGEVTAERTIMVH
jgi:hypothetical protein